MSTVPRVAAAALLVLALGSCTGTPVTAPGSAGPLQQGSFADVVERTAPAVVTVRTPNGIGSGVVYKPDVIVTNDHVVSDKGTNQNEQVTIDYADGSTSEGVVLATDPLTDLAVVRTQRPGLTAAHFRVELPRPGDPVLAIGSPLGFQNTVTAGVVSGLHRAIPGSATENRALADLVQTDAPISPGNSGGALLDAQGNVIGINEAYIPPAEGAVSLGFAVPSATVTVIADQLLLTGKAAHPYLGVSFGSLTPSIRQQLGVVAERGALVLGVDPGSPAGASGFRPGDVLTRFTGQQITGVEDALSALRRTRPGQRVDAEVVRGRDHLTLPVTVGSEN
jgi:serine protease Do